MFWNREYVWSGKLLCMNISKRRPFFVVSGKRERQVTRFTLASRFMLTSRYPLFARILSARCLSWLCLEKEGVSRLPPLKNLLQKSQLLKEKNWTPLLEAKTDIRVHFISLRVFEYLAIQCNFSCCSKTPTYVIYLLLLTSVFPFLIPKWITRKMIFWKATLKSLQILFIGTLAQPFIDY